MQNFFRGHQFVLLVYAVHRHQDRELVVPVSAAAVEVEVLSKLKFRITHLEASEGLVIGSGWFNTNVVYQNKRNKIRSMNFSGSV